MKIPKHSIMSPNKYWYLRDLCGTGHESGTSVGTELSQRPQSEQAEPTTSIGADTRQLLLREQSWARDLCRQATSQAPLRKQTEDRDLCGTRPKPGTSAGAGPRQGYLWEQAWTSYLSLSRPEATAATSTGAAWASDFLWSRPKAMPSIGADTGEPPQREQAWDSDLC